MASIEDVLAKASPDTRKRALDAGLRIPRRLATPSIGLTLGLKGGWAGGRQAVIWGAKSAGKSSFCQQQVAIAQQQGWSCAWIDVEDSWESNWSARMGVDNNNIGLFNPKTADQMADLVVDLIKAEVDLVVVDSISALLPPSFIEKVKKGDEVVLKPMAETGQIGSDSKAASTYTKIFNAVNENTVILLISQARTAVGSYGAPPKPTGGFGPMYNSSQVVRLWSSESGDNSVEGTITNGDQVFKTRIGRKVNWKVEYNKVGPQSRTGEYVFYYDGPHVGIDRLAEAVDLAKEHGIVEGSTWLNWNGGKWQGKDNFIAHLRENPEQAELLTKALYERL